MFRLGDELAVRLPRRTGSVHFLAKERAWVPWLAGRLPLRVPQPVAHGTPTSEFGHNWSIVEWLPGTNATAEQLSGPIGDAEALGQFVLTLRGLDPTNGPEHPRGEPVRGQDHAVRRALELIEGEVDTAAVRRAWDRVLEVPDHFDDPRWFHGDLGPLNLVASDGHITAVLDWGTCGVGDPAVDARVAWNLFDPAARQAYRRTAQFDDDAWERGRGWVLSGVTGIPYHRGSNPGLVDTLVHGINAVLTDRD